jgi:CheY-like chemotaxis protein
MLKAGSPPSCPVFVLLPLDASAPWADEASILRKPLSPSRLYDALLETSQPEGTSPSSTAESPDPSAPTFDILVAEDNDVNQQVLRQMLTQLGHHPTVVEDGAAAVQAVQDSEYDLVFMDLQMPTLNGLDATRRIHSLDLASPPPIVALTAGAFEDTRQKCRDAGMDDYLAKPVRLSDLQSVLDAVPAHSSPPQTDTDTGNDTPPALDTDMLESLAADVDAAPDDDFVQDLLERFVEQAISDLENMSSALEINDRAALEEHAHRLKGSARTVGAEQLAQAARSLETAAAEADPDALADKLETARETLNRFREALSAFLDAS